MKKSTTQLKKKPEEKVIIKHDLTQEQKLEIKEAFDAIDSDHSGFIDVEELKIAMQALGLDNRKDETSRIVEDMDKNKDGKISFEEFLSLLTLQITDKDHENEMKKIHSFISDESTQKINALSLKAICEDLGEEITEDEILEMIEEADYDKDGEVDINDFMVLMKKINVL
jgi:Ca2+-binding EF-hand superfamily protein